MMSDTETAKKEKGKEKAPALTEESSGMPRTTSPKTVTAEQALQLILNRLERLERYQVVLTQKLDNVLHNQLVIATKLEIPTQDTRRSAPGSSAAVSTVKPTEEAATKKQTQVIEEGSLSPRQHWPQ